jgi:AraC family transcriptional regulator, transcriptional activator FtrA
MAGSARSHRVAVLVFDHPSLFEMAVPCEVWGIDRTAVGVPPSEVRVCTPDPSPLHTDVGYTVTAPHGLEALRWADTVVVPAAPKPSGQRAAPDAALAALRAAHRRGARIASLCSGAFTLGESGLLDGRRATTHWMYTDAFRARFPLVELDPSVLYVGGDGIYTSAGTAAGIDLCLHLVRLDHGAEVANIVARRMVVPPHREGGQAQYVEAPLAELGREDPLAAVVTWAMGHLDRELSVNDLARRAFMAPRTFARRFRASIGSTPLQWLLHQRVTLAQRLLETTNLPIDAVARQAGFGSAPSLRQHFGRVVGTSPHAYRSRFRRAS